MKKKDKIISLELQVQTLTALLAEYVVRDAIRRIPVPEYTKGYKGDGLMVINSKPVVYVSDYNNYQDWLQRISDKNIERDFHKGMLEADKELQRVCKNNYYIIIGDKKYKIKKPFYFI